MNTIRSLLLLLGASLLSALLIGRAGAQEPVLPVGDPNVLPTHSLPNANGYYVSGGYLSSYKGSTHAGVDLSNKKSSGKVRAIASGKVVETRSSATSTWGNAILIQHDNLPGAPIYSLYAHMEDKSVSVGFHCVGGTSDGEECANTDDCSGGVCEGDSVNAGQPIGKVGDTGGDWGAHLHFEMKRVGTFGHGYFNVYDATRDVYEARRCSNNHGLKCHTDAGCVKPGVCVVRASSEDYIDPLEYIDTYGVTRDSTKFSIGDGVEITDTGINVRASASLDGISNDKRLASDAGFVVHGPTYADTYWWWWINFDEDPDGWVVEDFLRKVDAPLRETALIGIVPQRFTTDGGTFEISVSPKDADGNLIASGVTALNFAFTNISVALSSTPDEEVSGGSAETTDVEAILPAEGESATLVLSFDGSGSMLTNDPDLKRVAAGKQFVGLLGAGDQAAITDFGLGSTTELRVSRVLQNFTSDKVLLDEAIDQLTAALSFHGTPLYDALLDSLGLLGAILAPNPAVVVLTDGEENTSASTLLDVVTHANTLGIPLFTVGLGDGVGFAQLQTLSRDTGGVFAEASDPDALRLVFENIGFGIVVGRVVVTGQGTFVPQLQQAGEYIVSGNLVTTIGGASTGTPFSFPVNVEEAGSFTGASASFHYRIPYTAEEERQRALEFMYEKGIAE